MKLKRQLMVATMVLLTLPVAVWLVASGIESSLRELRLQSQKTIAESISSSLLATYDLSSLSASGDLLYVNQTDYSFLVDGYDDEWLAWKRWAMSFSDSGVIRLQLQLSRDSEYLYLLARVNDTSVSRARVVQSEFLDGDHLNLQITGRRGMSELRIVPGVPGSIELVDGNGNRSDTPISGAWRELENDRGYLVEIAIPLVLVSDSLGITAHDSGSEFQLSHTVEGTMINGQIAQLPLIFRQPDWSQFMARLLPQETRVWLINRQGWIMASADDISLRTGLTAVDEPPSGWQRLFYQLISRQTLKPLDRNTDYLLRITDPRLDRVFEGEVISNWSANENQNGMIATLMMPVMNNGDLIGALVIDQMNDRLLLATNQTLGKLLLISLAVVIGAAALIMLYASWLSRRVKRLRDATVLALASENPFSVSLPGQTDRDEIGDLARGFNSLLGDVREYDDYLKTLASRLSHEISTPLAVVKSSIENLKQENISTDARKYVERAQDGAERLQAMIRAMSEARRLEQALQATDPERFDLRDVVSGCFDACQVMDDCHQWRIDLPDQPVIINGAPELIAQMLDKLTDNARSFTPEEGEIILSLTQEKRKALISVANDGPELPLKLRNRLFNSLVSVRNKSDSSVHMGLGLHIVKLIARAHLGKVVAVNRPHQKGVEFIVHLVGLPESQL